MSDEVASTDYGKHSDDELRAGLRKAEDNLQRLSEEGSSEQREAAQAQHDAIQEELRRRLT